MERKIKVQELKDIIAERRCDSATPRPSPPYLHSSSTVALLVGEAEISSKAKHSSSNEKRLTILPTVKPTVLRKLRASCRFP